MYSNKVAEPLTREKFEEFIKFCEERWSRPAQLHPVYQVYPKWVLDFLDEYGDV